MKFRPMFTEVLPDPSRISEGELWISHKHRTINLRCPCGCGDLTVLSIHPSRWHVHFDGKTVSLEGPTGGSVWAISGCGSHYVIRNNAVIWQDKIDPARHADYARAERARMLASTSNSTSSNSASIRSLLRRWRRRVPLVWWRKRK